MTDFLTPYDIANRGLGHLGLGGAKRIVSFADDSKAASEMGFVYDKLRRAELRRNVWRFSVRKAVLRPLDVNAQALGFVAWNNATTYAFGAIVTNANVTYYSLTDGNLNHTPGVDFSNWAQYFGPLVATPYVSTIAYFSGEIVYISSVAYLSIQDNNTAGPPGATWRTLDAATLSAVRFLYPVGTGPASQAATRNVYMLPNGYLRQAPQDPKSGSSSFLGAPSGLAYDDWTFENNVFTSRNSDPVIFRFAADVAAVPNMDPMFCEGLSCRLALETCETLTQSDGKLQAIAQMYKQFMGEARTINGIEEGATEPPEDDWVTCRI